MKEYRSIVVCRQISVFSIIHLTEFYRHFSGVTDFSKVRAVDFL